LIFEERHLRDQKWDERFMLLAHHLATWSIEKGRRVGTVIVGPDNEIRSTGFNGLPRAFATTSKSAIPASPAPIYLELPRRAERDLQCRPHRRAARRLHHLRSLVPCVECTKAIIQSGLKELVAYAPDQPNSNWHEDFAIAGQMLREGRH